jgi:hypothetical protein
MFSSIADTLDFSTGGVSRIQVTTTNLNSTVPLLVALSSATTPSYSFTGDTNTGMFSSIADTLDLSTGGVSRIQITTTNLNSTLPLLVALSSATTPSYSFTGDPNTGMFSSAADTLDLSTGGSTKVQITTVSLNSGVPVLTTTGSTAAPGYSFSGDTDTGLWSSGANTINFSTSGTSRMQLSITELGINLPVNTGLGTAATPSYSFTGDTNTGMFSSLADTIDFSTGGTSRVQVTNGAFYSTTPFYTSAGSALVPSISFTGDPNTGIYNSAADTLNFTTGGISRASFSNTLFSTTVKQYMSNAESAYSFYSDLTHATYASTAITLNFARAATNAYNAFQVLTGGTITIATLSGLGNWQIGDGNATIPAYSFNSDQNTGMYSGGADVLNFTTGGTSRLSISTTNLTSTLQIIGPNGGTAAPGFRCTSEATGFSVPAAGTLAFSVAGSSQVNINATRFATGIPIYVADGGFNTPSYAFSGETTTGIYRASASQIGFATGLASGEYVARITNDGIVGIRNRDSGTFLQCVNMQAYGSGFTANVYYSYAATATTTGYNFILFDNNGGKAWRVRGDGATYADNAYNSGGADYAEWFETSDGKTIPVGSSIVLDGTTGKIKIAAAGDEAKIIGVVRPKINSNCCVVIGNSAEDYWNPKFEKDEYGAFIMENVDYYKWVDEKGETKGYYANQIPDGVVVPEDKEVVPDQPMKKINPLYDPNLSYQPRSERPEWHIIGMMGQIPVANGQILGTNWQLMRNINDGTIAKMYLVK